MRQLGSTKQTTDKKTKRPRGHSYQPHKGYIGKYEVDVANYIFKAAPPKGKVLRVGYEHSEALVDAILGRSIHEHHQSSQRLTRFLKKRDLTFQKTDKDGIYRIFTVPVTTTVVPLPKSVFNRVEAAAQVLCASLRMVLQSIYGSKSIAESPFVQSLPPKIRKTFLAATELSPHYIPQLHHENMKTYPFFDNVGLDLVLIEEYFQLRGNLTKWIEEGREDKLPELPFRILELNAGSPSGASNNLNILEGILREDPAILDAVGKVFPNDHFEVLRRTYQSLGESWTGRTDGVQIILPPGGANGASPEIHQLAAYSGLIYCDPSQLYRDGEGWIRMRTVNQALDPIVTAIYSRVNSDSALFDHKQGILLRDPESGEPIYVIDVLKPWKDGKPEFVKDTEGELIPLESDYTIPGAVDAILNRRLYMGGLNRLLDNKIILATLTEFAPEFFRVELEKMGLFLNESRISPPECLPSTRVSLAKIEKNPKDWVIKSPNLSGGTGVYILMTLDERRRREVIAEAKRNPEHYAYQKVVKIGRIPVATRASSTGGYRFANLAADIRMWVFYGGEGTLPVVTHNALVRYAPREKGPMSSIVNTSKGGGYAPFVVVDDLGTNESVTAREMAAPREPAPFQAPLPAFVAAQVVQVAKLVQELRDIVRSEQVDLYRISGFLYSLKLQVREIASFVHPKCMETIYSMLEITERRIDERKIADYYFRMNFLQARLVSKLQELDMALSADFYMVLDEFNILNQDTVNTTYNYEMKRQDIFTFGHFNYVLRKLGEQNPGAKRGYKAIKDLVKEMVNLPFPSQPISPVITQRLESLLDQFSDLASRRLKASFYATEFAALFDGTSREERISYLETFVIPHPGQAPRSGTEWEAINQRLITESEFIESDIQAARQDWLKVLEQSRKIRPGRREVFIEKSRKAHFLKYPRLVELQEIIDRKENTDVAPVVALMSVLPYAAYNLRQYAIEQNVSFVELFCNTLAPERISLLSREERIASRLSADQFSGECFAKKRQTHGLISDSDRYMWIAKEQSPLVQLYTIGHELVHAAQIHEVIEMERQAIKDGPIAFARFLNHYGNFLCLASNTLENADSEVARTRKPLYGLADRMVSQFFTRVIQDVRDGLKKGTAAYHAALDQYGSLFGYMMPVSPVVRVRALREVIPALENAKNIIFAKECGLDIRLDEVKSALPSANRLQRSRYRKLIRAAARNPQLDFEALRIIASHQYYGVMFYRHDNPEANLALRCDLGPIHLNTGYNQTQQ
ncbi:MAG: hypothetical protein JST80_12230 [Bdellovibrionales bacterium]|nr:hypothetical protein [Bdellovibrionales bacterium]